MLSLLTMVVNYLVRKADPHQQTGQVGILLGALDYNVHHFTVYEEAIKASCGPVLEGKVAEGPVEKTRRQTSTERVFPLSACRKHHRRACFPVGQHLRYDFGWVLQVG